MGDTTGDSNPPPLSWQIATTCYRAISADCTHSSYIIYIPGLLLGLFAYYVSVQLHKTQSKQAAEYKWPTENIEQSLSLSYYQITIRYTATLLSLRSLLALSS